MLSPLLLVTNHLTVGGAERHLVSWARWLCRRGVTVAVAASPGPLVADLPDGVRFFPLPLSDVRLGLPLAAARLGAVLRRVRPQVVVANSVVTALACRLASRRPLVQVAHGWAAARMPAVARLSRVSQRVIAVSEGVAEGLRAAGLPRQKIRVVLNGIDLRPFQGAASDRDGLRAELGVEPTDLLVISVGRWVPSKAPHTVIDLAFQLPQAHFLLLGHGPLEPALRDQIAASGLAHRVRLVPGEASAVRFLRAADIYLSTSRHEGRSLATMEALAAGLPVVQRCGLQAPGVITAPTSVALRGALAALVAQPTRRASLGVEARAHALTEFGADRMCEGLQAVLEEVA